MFSVASDRKEGGEKHKGRVGVVGGKPSVFVGLGGGKFEGGMEEMGE